MYIYPHPNLHMYGICIRRFFDRVLEVGIPLARDLGGWSWWSRRNGGVFFFEFRDHPPYPLVNIQKSWKSPFFIGKSTISMTVFKSYVIWPEHRNTMKGNSLLYYAMYLKLVRSNDFKDFYMVRQCLFELLKELIHDLAKDIRSGFCSHQHIVI